MSDLESVSQEVINYQLLRLREIDESRLAILRVGHLRMLGLLRGDEKLLDKLPDDIRLVSVHYDPQYRAFTVTLQSETFDVVPEGSLIPAMNPEWEVITDARNADHIA